MCKPHMYLFYDATVPDCRNVAELLDRNGFLFTRIPSRAIVEATLVFDGYTLDGLEGAVRGLKFLGLIPEDG